MRCKTPNSQKHSNFLNAIHLIMEGYHGSNRSNSQKSNTDRDDTITNEVHNSTTPTEQTCQATAVQTKVITQETLPPAKPTIPIQKVFHFPQ